jgi:hypothetical protein
MKTSEWISSLREFKGFPHISLGWPMQEYGVEPDDEKAYEEYREECEFNDEEPAPFDAWMKGDRAADLEELDGKDDLGFMWSNCDLCNSGLGGDRYAATALPENPAENRDYVPLEICVDCLCWVANGDVPDFLEED